MFVIPDEKILFTSTECLSPDHNKCYILFNQNILNYLEKYKVLRRALNKDVAMCIMQYLDPRLSIHNFSLRNGTITCRRFKYQYKFCYRCYQKIII